MSKPRLRIEPSVNPSICQQNFSSTRLAMPVVFAILMLFQSCQEKKESIKSIDIAEIKKKVNLPYANLNLQAITDPIKIAAELGFKKVEKLSENEIRFIVWPPEDEEEEWSYLCPLMDSD